MVFRNLGLACLDGMLFFMLLHDELILELKAILVVFLFLVVVCLFLCLLLL